MPMSARASIFDSLESDNVNDDSISDVDDLASIAMPAKASASDIVHHP